MNEGIDELRVGMREDDALERVVRASERQGRYTFVNVCNSNTVELRFNRGTLKLPTIYACLQLASNLALFARDHSIDEVLDAKWDDVVHSYEYDELSTYVAERFAGFLANEATRPTTNYRTTAVPTPTPASSGFGTDNDIVTKGCVLEDIRSSSDVLPGDLVVRTEENPDDGPRFGDIGVITPGNVMPAVWNTVNPTSRNLRIISSPGYPARQWRSSASMMRVIRTLRNGDAPDRAANLAGAEHGFIPGMRVHHNDIGDGTLLRLTCNSLGRVIAHVSWDAYKRHGAGHNDEGMVDDRSAWNFLLDDIVALN